MATEAALFEQEWTLPRRAPWWVTARRLAVRKPLGTFGLLIIIFNLFRSVWVGPPAELRWRMILTADLAALTRDLVGRLGQRADVAYAQPSHVVRPLGGDAR